jgi:hypothetical protein
MCTKNKNLTVVQPISMMFTIVLAVAIPFADIVKQGEISGWYDVDSGENLIAHKFVSTEIGKKPTLDDSSRSHDAQLFLTVRWIPPSDIADIAAETEREASVAIQEEMVRSASITRQQKEKLGLLGSSLGALNTVRGISGNLLLVQNMLGSILNTAESCIHALDFTVSAQALDFYFLLSLFQPFFLTIGICF